MIPSFRLPNNGAILSDENLFIVRRIISALDSLVSDSTACTPPISFKISSDNQVWRLFL